MNANPTPTLVCEVCEVSNETVQRRHRNTMYQDDESNYMTSCQACFDEDWAYYQELWDDINRDIAASISDAMSRRSYHD